MKVYFVTGGVVSGLGKGITAASLGRLLKARGLKVAAQKLDPYINVDPGTMSPYQHGEVFVTEDGAETDLDLGHYERFIDEDPEPVFQPHRGRVYSNVISKERRGSIWARPCRPSPHHRRDQALYLLRGQEDRGRRGHHGDRRHHRRHGEPALPGGYPSGGPGGRPGQRPVYPRHPGALSAASGEHKSKPTQHSVKELQGFGISPDIIVLRCDEPITDRSVFEKIAGFAGCQRPDCVIENVTLPSLYEAPLMLEAANFSGVCRELGLRTPPA